MKTWRSLPLLSLNVLLLSTIFLQVPECGGEWAPTSPDAGVITSDVIVVAPDVAPPPVRTPAVFLTVGDSITAGYPDLPAGGYRDPLHDLLVADGWPAPSWVGSFGPIAGVAHAPFHDGFNGYRIDDSQPHGPPWGISPYFPQHVTRYQPTHVLLLIGTNDLQGHIPIDQMLASVSRLIDSITQAAPFVRVVVGTVLPAAPDDGTHPAYQREPARTNYNAELRTLVAGKAAAGARVTIAETAAEVEAEAASGNVPWADGLHPNAIGYAAVARGWRTALAALPVTP